MARKQWLMAVAAVGLSAALAAPALGQQAKAAKGKPGGGGGGGKKTTTVSVAQLTIHDEPGVRLFSDAVERIGTDTDGDGDGFWELVFPASSSAVVYQDVLINFDDSGVHPDPCSVFVVTTDGINGGRARALLDSQSCSFVNPDFGNDARTYSLQFDKNEAGGSCACDQFRYLDATDGTGNPAPMYNGQPAQTSFTEDANSCTLGIAAGVIQADGSSYTASQQIIAWPYEEFLYTKGKKSSQTIPGMTSVHFNFRTDRINPGESKNWLLWSQAEAIFIDNPDSPADLGVRDVTSNGGQLFDLSLAGGDTMCTDITLPFHITFKKFEVVSQ